MATFPTCPVTEIARLGRTLRQWKTAFLAHGFTNRDNYRLGMLLIGGGLDQPHQK